MPSSMPKFYFSEDLSASVEKLTIWTNTSDLRVCYLEWNVLITLFLYFINSSITRLISKRKQYFSLFFFRPSWFLTPTMPTLKSLIFVQLFLTYLVSAHGGASHAHGSTQDEKENTNWKYAQRHVGFRWIDHHSAPIWRLSRWQRNTTCENGTIKILPSKTPITDFLFACAQPEIHLTQRVSLLCTTWTGTLPIPYGCHNM